ncbi:MAG: hypothetical protein ACLU38_10970 [Dysosmobacter sp.]
MRVNPDFTYTADTGVASKFGIDEQLIYDSMEAWKKLPNIRIVGLHAHLKSQELSAETLKGYYRNMFRLSVSMREAFGTLKFVNLGSGMGIPFCETDKPFDTTALGAETQRLMAEFQEKLPETRFYIETGRYAVGTAGTYVAKVVDKEGHPWQELRAAQRHAERLCPSLHGGHAGALHGQWPHRRMGADLHR